MRAVMRGADDHKKRSVRTLEHFLETPPVANTAACVVDVGQKRGTELAIGLQWLRQSWPFGARKQIAKLLIQYGGIAAVATNTRRFADGMLAVLPPARSLQ